MGREGRGGDNKKSSSSLFELLRLVASDSASCWQRKKESTKTFERYFALTYPQKPQGQRGGITLTLLGGLLPSLPVSPMLVLPCEALRVAGESGDGVWASYLRTDPLSLTSTESIPQPDYPYEFY